MSANSSAEETRQPRRAAKSSIGITERLLAWLGFPLLLAVVFFSVGRSARPTEIVSNMVRFYTFDQGANTEWSSDRVSHARFAPRTESPDLLPTRSRRFFLGPFGAETIDLNLDEELPPHQSVTVSLDLFIIRSWDGNAPGLGFDRFQIRHDDDPDPTFNASFTNSGPRSITTQSYPYQFEQKECPGTTGASEVGTLGFDFRGSARNSVYRISNSFAHRSSTLRIRFSGVGLNDESWGLDNVSVRTSSQLEPNPEPNWATDCQDPD